MKFNNDYEFRILLSNHKPIQEYEHQGRHFVEGRKGSEFELEFKNKTGGRLLVIPSVDGLSPLDGKQANAESKGYVVPPQSTLVIPGWTLDGQNVAKFIFQDRDKSYVAAMSQTGNTNAGVVGVLVYREHVTFSTPPARNGVINPPVKLPTPIVPNNPWWDNTNGLPPAPMCGMGGMIRSETPPADVKKVFSGPYYTRSASSDASGVYHAPNTADATPQSMTSSVASTETTFDLGTGWGAKQEFKTNQTTFNKGDLVAQMALFYDSRRNLEKRGIEVVKRERTYLDDLPAPFQDVGCKPPPGWQG